MTWKGWLILSAFCVFQLWLVIQIVRFAPPPCGFHEQCWKRR